MAGDWSDLSTVLETSPGPLCPVDCHTGDLSTTALEEQGLAVSGRILYLAERTKLTNMSQLCLQGLQDPITVLLEDSGQEKEKEKEKECSRWCSRWGDLTVKHTVIS